MQLTADLAIHAWDLARATGQDDTLDPHAVALLLPWTEANADLVRRIGHVWPTNRRWPRRPGPRSVGWACSAAKPERPPRAARVARGPPSWARPLT